MIDLPIHTQPDDETCGPTCLHAVYKYYGLDISLQQVIHAVERSASGGTLAPLLGKDALQRGFNATIYVNNLDVIDPTWFRHGSVPRKTLIDKLITQRKHKEDHNVVRQTNALIPFLKLGGHIKFCNMTVRLLKNYFKQGVPILTGLSATYLYGCARETFSAEGQSTYDDINGTPCGHFVVLCGYDEKKKRIVVADPHRENPLSHDNYYKVSISRLINAILLGVLTLDGNLLIIQPNKDVHANNTGY